MQHPVGVVKHDLLHQQTDNQLCQDPVEGGENPGGKERLYKSWMEECYWPDICYPSPLIEEPHWVAEDWLDYKPVEQNHWYKIPNK